MHIVESFVSKTSKFYTFSSSPLLSLILSLNAYSELLHNNSARSTTLYAQTDFIHYESARRRKRIIKISQITGKKRKQGTYAITNSSSPELARLEAVHERHNDAGAGGSEGVA